VNSRTNCFPKIKRAFAQPLINYRRIVFFLKGNFSSPE
jgi:hypothetical protein